MFIPILKKDNTLESEIEKFKEEVEEVIHYRDEENLKEELWDVIQMSVGLLYQVCNKDTLAIKWSSKKHIEKLMSRGWQIEKMININMMNVSRKEDIKVIKTETNLDRLINLAKELIEDKDKVFTLGEILEEYQKEHKTMHVKISKDDLMNYTRIGISEKKDNIEYAIFLNGSKEVYLIATNGCTFNLKTLMNNNSKFEEILYKLYALGAKVNLEEQK